MNEAPLPEETTVNDEVLSVEPDVNVPATAIEGAAARTPKPKAETATSAMRLRVVFVDICFLSISRLSDVPSAGFR
jgi:hypothetical protein